MYYVCTPATCCLCKQTVNEMQILGVTYNNMLKTVSQWIRDVKEYK